MTCVHRLESPFPTPRWRVGGWIGTADSGRPTDQVSFDTRCDREPLDMADSRSSDLHSTLAGSVASLSCSARDSSLSARPRARPRRHQSAFADTASAANRDTRAASSGRLSNSFRQSHGPRSSRIAERASSKHSRESRILPPSLIRYDPAITRATDLAVDLDILSWESGNRLAPTVTGEGMLAGILGNVDILADERPLLGKASTAASR